ncbi:DUF1641 domain-containing protein [Pantoea cypripedii]|jgi:uncharacterized protein YjgD (DUF1641 family)|uniref:DUF1641 domain-containing protein n=1 Tax=Pantoea cypripedii TaxID=55209 RepID=A0A6B9GG46_PANCY|nr:DUF1641 domain-containing protein [Pantoea cypripedii]QGY32475.1 hypothetical protein CUN67_26245 [Pantoea cypripedii]
MAERLEYQVPPTRTEATAQEALDELIENLHQHGFLRLANDAVKANSDIGKILVAGLNRPATQNAIQNFSLLLMAIGTIPPERFNHILLALREAAMALKPASDDAEQSAAPGVRGVLKLLNDDALWQSLRPFFAAVETFSEQMRQDEQPPVTRYSGKSTHE